MKGTTMFTIASETQVFILRVLAILAAVVLIVTGHIDLHDLQLSDAALAAIVGVLGLAQRRPGDTSPVELARALESADPTRQA